VITVVTGTRLRLSADNRKAIDDILIDTIIQPEVLGRRVVLVHGDCPTGVDEWINTWGDEAADIFVEAHPADWSKHGGWAGPIRNKDMVDAGADICLAFPKGESRGTRGCTKLAEKAGIATLVTELS
jgi:hypothetical protein